MEKIRSFVAVLLPETIRCRLAEIEESLKKTEADVRWVSSENFHITLKFLGDVETDRIGLVTESIANASQGVAPFEVQLSGVGAFPSAGRARVVWVGIDSGVEQLKHIAERLDLDLAKVGFPREDRPFSGHVTLGRVKTPRGLQALRAAMEEIKGISIGSVTVDKIALMRSELRPTGPIYTVLDEVKLG